MPTTTRSGIVGREDVERKLAPGEVVVDAALHERRAMDGTARKELLAREPVQRDDLLVERPLVEPLDAAAEAEAQEGDVRGRVVPAVDADECGWGEAMRGLLEHLAAAGRHQRLARVEVAGGLVEHPSSVDELFHQKETAVALDDGGHRRRRL